MKVREIYKTNNSIKQQISRLCYATTSAELKLLRRRRTLLSNGRSDLEPGTTTAEGSLFIHASGAGGG